MAGFLITVKSCHRLNRGTEHGKKEEIGSLYPKWPYTLYCTAELIFFVFLCVLFCSFLILHFCVCAFMLLCSIVLYW